MHTLSFPSCPPKRSKTQPDTGRRLNASQGRCLAGLYSDWAWPSWVSGCP